MELLPPGTLINLSEWRPAVCRKSDPPAHFNAPARLDLSAIQTATFSRAAFQVSSHILKISRAKPKQRKNPNNVLH